MNGAPWWQRRLIQTDNAVAPRLAAVLHNEDVLTALGLIRMARSGVERKAEQASRRALHILNLPAGSDITRLHTRLAGLERQVRELTKIIEDSGQPHQSDGISESPRKEAQKRATSNSRRRTRPGAS